MRVTPDTGILVRMNVKASGSARRLLEVILAGPHELVLSEFILEETARVLRYPRMQKLFKLTADEIVEHIQSLRTRADMVVPVVHQAVVIADPDDDPIVFTAVAGHADVLCTLDRDFYSPEVVSFCSDYGIQILSDVELLQKLKSE